MSAVTVTGQFTLSPRIGTHYWISAADTPMDRALATARRHPLALAGVGTIVGYALVIGTFLGVVPIYPSINEDVSTTLSHAIAVVNALTVVTLSLGWYWIRRGRVERHRRAMLTAFALISLFLVLYLTRVGGGGTKHFVGPEPVATAYLVMLGIHVLLSIVAVPVVLYAVALGITHRPEELSETPHATVGRVAAASWLVSLLLGLVTYLMLEHVYGAEYVAALVPVVG